MTRRTTYLAWIALLSTAAVPASAAQIVADFTVNVSGSADQDYLSTPFDLFDPSLGTLTSVTETVTGPPPTTLSPARTWARRNSTSPTAPPMERRRLSRRRASLCRRSTACPT